MPETSDFAYLPDFIEPLLDEWGQTVWIDRRTYGRLLIDDIVFTLPIVSSFNKKLVPKLPGIYLLVDSKEILYVGSSKNLHRRLCSNPLSNDHNSRKILYILQKTGDKEQRILAEDFLIIFFRPSANLKLNKIYSIDKVVALSEEVAIRRKAFCALSCDYKAK